MMIERIFKNNFSSRKISVVCLFMKMEKYNELKTHRLSQVKDQVLDNSKSKTKKGSDIKTKK